MKSTDHFLKDFLEVAPLSHALWRSVEAISFSKVDIKKESLDIGCGFGEFAGVVFDKIQMGIDINEHDLEKARKGNSYKNILLADARKQPFKDASFLTVISVSVLEHIENPEVVLLEVNRILRKGGIFAFSVPTTSLYNSLLIPKICNVLRLKKIGKFYFKMHCKAFKHVTLRSSKWWERKIKEADFQVILKEGTISASTARIHELFLPFALPSQLWKYFFGKRVLFPWINSIFLPIIFNRFVYSDKNSDINLFFVLKK